MNTSVPAIVTSQKPPLVKILYVEDGVDAKASAVLLEQCTMTIPGHMCSVTVVNSIFTALVYTEHTLYDMILVTNNLPRLNAIDMFKILRSVGNQTPMILMMGIDETLSFDESTFVMDNFHSVLKKPFSSSKLCHAIYFVISNGQSFSQPNTPTNRSLGLGSSGTARVSQLLQQQPQQQQLLPVEQPQTHGTCVTSSIGAFVDHPFSDIGDQASAAAMFDVLEPSFFSLGSAASALSIDATAEYPDNNFDEDTFQSMRLTDENNASASSIIESEEMEGCSSRNSSEMDSELQHTLQQIFAHDVFPGKRGGNGSGGTASIHHNTMALAETIVAATLEMSAESLQAYMSPPVVEALINNVRAVVRNSQLQQQPQAKK